MSTFISVPLWKKKENKQKPQQNPRKLKKQKTDVSDPQHKANTQKKFPDVQETSNTQEVYIVYIFREDSSYSSQVTTPELKPV